MCESSFNCVFVFFNKDDLLFEDLLPRPHAAREKIALQITPSEQVKLNWKQQYRSAPGVPRTPFRANNWEQRRRLITE